MRNRWRFTIHCILLPVSTSSRLVTTVTRHELGASHAEDPSRSCSNSSRNVECRFISHSRMFTDHWIRGGRENIPELSKVENWLKMNLPSADYDQNPGDAEVRSRNDPGIAKHTCAGPCPRTQTLLSDGGNGVSRDIPAMSVIGYNRRLSSYIDSTHTHKSCQAALRSAPA